MQRRDVLKIAMAGLILGGCAAPPGTGPEDVDALAREVAALGPKVDPDEATRAARIAYGYTQQLARDYEVTDPPLVHNAKVHGGQRDRGLCNHWAEDLHRRLSQEGFRTLSVQRAISPRSPFRIIHHAAVITRPGDTIHEGIILDGWRHGGALFWAPTREDDRYNWRPRAEVVREMIAARDD
ncbi:hypothetical protein [Roseovarius salinarum]|uniref:hypothetical protein n=1 Tax=Roseovarius salinarum TaxID=1981892 RepID=UPI000C341B0A|nr:hypothetical protein [Roseovarius salinarum]